MATSTEVETVIHGAVIARVGRSHVCGTVELDAVGLSQMAGDIAGKSQGFPVFVGGRGRGQAANLPVGWLKNADVSGGDALLADLHIDPQHTLAAVVAELAAAGKLRFTIGGERDRQAEEQAAQRLGLSPRQLRPARIKKLTSVCIVI